MLKLKTTANHAILNIIKKLLINFRNNKKEVQKYNKIDYISHLITQNPKYQVL